MSGSPNPYEPILDSPSNHSGQSPQKRPKLGLLLGIASFFVGGILFTLQVNHTEVSLKISAIIYLICISGLVWTFLSHGVPHRGWFVKVFGSMVIIAGGIWISASGIQSETRFQQALKTPPPQDPYKEAYSALTNSLSNHPGDPQLAIAEAQQKIDVQEGKNLAEEHDILDRKPVDLPTIRDEQANLLARNENAKKLREDQQKINDLAAQKKYDDWMKIVKEKNAEDERFETEVSRFISSETLPVYDFVIKDFYNILMDVSSKSGDRKRTNLPEPPTVYGSQMEQGGLAIIGTNYIQVGSNSIWHFRFSTTIPMMYDPTLGNAKTMQLEISCSNTNGISQLIVYPKFYDQFTPLTLASIEQSGHLHMVISIHLVIPNVIETNNNYTEDNYATDLDKDIGLLIGSQDQQSPLSTR